MQANGKTINNMEKALNNGQMDKDTKDSIKMDQKLAREF